MQLVSLPLASSPAACALPAGQATQAWAETYSFSVHKIDAQVVSAPEASSPAAREVPAAHATQVFPETR